MCTSDFVIADDDDVDECGICSVISIVDQRGVLPLLSCHTCNIFYVFLPENLRCLRFLYLTYVLPSFLCVCARDNQRVRSN